MIKEENGKLLKVLSCRFRESSNTKTLKFSWEPEGTMLYYKKTNDSWLFSTEEIAEVAVPVRKGKVHKGYFTYINVRNIITSYDGDVAVYRQDEHTYLVKPATADQMQLRTVVRKKEEGDIKKFSDAFYIHLNKTRFESVFGELKFAKIHVVQNGLKAYMEVSPASTEDISKLPLLNAVKTPWGGWQTLDLVEEYTYIHPKPSGNFTKQSLHCPISFIRNHNKDLMPFMVWQREDEVVIVEPHPLICETCGKKISRYKDVSVKGYTCGSCKKALPKIKQLITTEDFDTALYNIRGVQSLLDSIMKN